MCCAAQHTVFQHAGRRYAATHASTHLLLLLLLPLPVLLLLVLAAMAATRRRASRCVRSPLPPGPSLSTAAAAARGGAAARPSLGWRAHVHAVLRRQPDGQVAKDLV